MEPIDRLQTRRTPRPDGRTTQRLIPGDPVPTFVPSADYVPPAQPAAAAAGSGPIRAWLVCSPFPAVPLREGQEASLGRKVGCNLVLPHTSVSRKHAVVRLVNGALTFEDLGSANGSHLNGKPAQGPVSLSDGDVLKLGPFEVQVRSTAEESDFDKTCSVVPELAQGEALTGALAEMPLSEVLQSLEFNAKTGTLKVYAPGGVGEVGVSNGRPLWATYRSQTDDEAVLELLLLAEGRFSLSPQLASAEARMKSTFMSLLLEASRRSDEG
ncbi:MAG: DUF4388 domain-containing protein [Planctomycetota bacterium]